MYHNLPARPLRLLAWVLLAGGLSASVYAQDDLLDQLLNLDQADLASAAFSGLPTEPQALADEISQQVARMRGLEFSQPIAVSHQSMADFERYLDGEMERAIPAERSAVFGRIAAKLGLYNGPVIEDANGLVRQLATSQVAAYYDPDSSGFYVLLEDAPMELLAPIYAHELYHGLQDQHFDLDAYLLDGMANGLNDDELLARQSVVEGEATYIMNLWALESAIGQTPPRWIVSATVLAQSMLSTSAMAALADSDLFSAAVGEEMAASAQQLNELPAFLIETMVGAYLKGMAFVHAIAGNGWESVARLYTDPPQSTEQILHPEKWLERDVPVRFAFAGIEGEPALRDWELLESNVIGEFQWRIIFSEFGQRLQSAALAAGWDGDRYAVFERDDELLLLLLTTWDTEADAQDFASAYETLLVNKYEGKTMPVMVRRQASDVLIVEGGDPDSLDDFRAILERAERR